MSTPITTPAEAFLTDSQEAQTAIHRDITADGYWTPVSFVAEFKKNSIVWFNDKRYMKITNNANNTISPDLNTIDWKELDQYMIDTVLTPQCITTPLLSTTNLILPFRTNGQGATGTDSTSFGTGASANGNGSIALGGFSAASGIFSAALGFGANAASSNSTALGVTATALSSNSTAVGHNSRASVSDSTAVGRNATSANSNATSVGSAATAGGINSSALGANANTLNAETNTVKLGDDNITNFKCKVALTVTSDERDKANIENLEKNKAIAFLKSLKPIVYNSDCRTNYLNKEKVIEKRTLKKICEKTGEEIEQAIEFERDACQRDAYDEQGNLINFNKDLKAKNSKCASIVEVGLSAQDVEKALNEVFGDKNFGRIVSCTSRCGTTGNPTGVKEEYSSKGIAYSNLIPFLIQGFQHQQKEIESLRAEINDLKNQKI